jgi:predicted PurR-regulated permease PerM
VASPDGVIRLEVSRRALFIALGVLAVVFAIVRLYEIVVVVAAAFIFMAALQPYVAWLVQRSVPRVAAVLLLMLAIVVVFGGLMALVVPALVDEFTTLKDELPENARDLEDFLADFGIEVELEERAEDFEWSDILSGRAAVDYGQRVALIIFGIFTVIVLTAYLLVDVPRLSRFVYQFVPPGKEPEVERFLASLSRVVGGYVRGQLITSACITVFTLIVLLACGVPNAFAFAFVAGIADAIPLIGAFIATIPAVVAAFQESPTTALIVLGLLIAYQQFEDRFLVPRVYGQTLNLPPIIVLVVVLIGGSLFGITGVLLAMPAAAAGRVVLDYALDKRKSRLAPPGPATEVAAPDTSASRN